MSELDSDKFTYQRQQRHYAGYNLVFELYTCIRLTQLLEGKRCLFVSSLDDPFSLKSE